MTLPDIIGILGVGIILLAYFQIQTGRITADHLRYSLLNLVGSVMMLVSLYYRWNTPSVLIQTCWIAISLYGIWKVTKRRLPHADE